MYDNLSDNLKNKYNKQYRKQLDLFNEFFGNVEEQIIEGEQNHLKNVFFEIEDDNYSFIKIYDKTIGEDNTLTGNKEISHVKFYGVEFNNCIFKNVTFKNCSFIGCKFNKCIVQPLNLIFENCFFSVPIVTHEINKQYFFQSLITVVLC